MIGAGMSLNSVIELLDEVSSSNANYKYCKTIANHIRKVAHPSVRNAGTIGGNLMLKHTYQGINWLYVHKNVKKHKASATKKVTISCMGKINKLVRPFFFLDLEWLKSKSWKSDF